MSKAEKQYLAKVAELGCIICKSPAEIHHIRSGMGIGQRNNNSMVLPLCPQHHRTGGFGIAIHAGQKTWEQNFGTELELLEIVKRRI